jgi:hypothetical protein
VQPLPHEKRQVRVRSESPVTDQYIAGPHLRVELGDAGHLVGPQGAGQQVLKESRASVEQGDELGHWESAPGALVDRVPELLGQVCFPALWSHFASD